MEITEGELHQHLLHYTDSSELEAAKLYVVADTAEEPAAAPAAAAAQRGRCGGGGGAIGNKSTCILQDR